MSFILNSFNCRKFSFSDPVHKFPWAALLVCDFFYFVIEEKTFCFLNSAFEAMPVFKTSMCLIFIKR